MDSTLIGNEKASQNSTWLGPLPVFKGNYLQNRSLVRSKFISIESLTQIPFLNPAFSQNLFSIFHPEASVGIILRNKTFSHHNKYQQQIDEKHTFKPSHCQNNSISQLSSHIHDQPERTKAVTSWESYKKIRVVFRGLFKYNNEDQLKTTTFISKKNSSAELKA